MIEANDRLLVIYHANCADGFTAAWAIWKRFGEGADYLPATYQSPPPDVTGRRVILCDFAYPRETLRDMARAATCVLVLDHHKSAAGNLRNDPSTGDGPAVLRMDQWAGELTWERFLGAVAMDVAEGLFFANVYALFDMERSGAGITWDFFHPGVQRPALVNHVEDRDLWRFEIPGTREFQAAVFSYEYTFANWEYLHTISPSVLIAAGAAIERKHHKDVAELVKVCKRRMTIAGHDVPVASLPYTLTSDAGHMMAQGETFAACYWDTAEGRVFSLRSTIESGTDVSAIAALFGGGGHDQASGFKVPRDHELARS